MDAAAQALVDGLDSPALRMLAGAPVAAADDDADTYAQEAFEELGLNVASRNSERAIVEGARERAVDFLADEVSARELTKELYRAHVSAGYPEDLAAWSDFDDLYDMLDSKVISGDRRDVDQAVRRAAEALVDGQRVGAIGISDLFTAQSNRKPESVVRRLLLRWRR